MRQGFRRWIFAGGSALLALALVLPPAGVVGQTTTAGVRGTVSDENGAPVANAALVARNTDSGFTQVTSTGAGGGYNLALAPGTYEIRIEAPGFEPVTQTIRVLIGQNLDLDIQIGRTTRVTEAIVVFGQAG